METTRTIFAAVRRRESDGRRCSDADGSGGDGGATIILTETPTQAPTPVATIQPVGTSTIKPTTKPATSKSPAPFVGIIAGLGAALIIARMRR